MSQVGPWLILSLQSLPSIHPPHCWQNDLAADLIMSLWSLKSSHDSPFVRPSLIWSLFSAQVSTPILCLHIMFQWCRNPRTSSKKCLSLLYLSDPSPGASLSCSAHQSTKQTTWLTRRAVPQSGGLLSTAANRRALYASSSLSSTEFSQQYQSTLITIKCRTQPFFVDPSLKTFYQLRVELLAGKPWGSVTEKWMRWQKRKITFRKYIRCVSCITNPIFYVYHI